MDDYNGDDGHQDWRCSRCGEHSSYQGHWIGKTWYCTKPAKEPPANSPKWHEIHGFNEDGTIPNWQPECHDDLY